MTYHLYMVQCADGTYYTGATNNLEARIKLHNAGRGAKYVRGKGPVQLVYQKGYRYYKNALSGERWLKKRSHQEKAALIREYQRQDKIDMLGPKISSLSGRNQYRGPSVRLEA